MAKSRQTGDLVSQNNLFVDNANDRIGIGTTSPQGILETFSSSASNVYLTSTGGNSNLRIVAQDGAVSSLVFGDTSDAFTGGISFDHSDNSLQLFGHNYTERARIDSTCRLLLGTSTYINNWNDNQKLVIAGTGVQGISIATANNLGVLAFGRSGDATPGSNALVAIDDNIGVINFAAGDGSTRVNAARIQAFVDGTPSLGGMPGRLVLYTTADGASNPTEAMRITARQSILMNSTSETLGIGDDGVVFVPSAAYTAGHHIAKSVSSGALVLGIYGSVGQAIVRGDGDLENTNNSYTGISDIKLKENIVNANSQWNDIKSLQVRNYNFKAETKYNTHTQIGLIAQEVELVSPGLVSESPDRDEEDNDLGTVTKSVNYSVLYMKAVKALQEAMERIETLETKVAALEAN